MRGSFDLSANETLRLRQDTLSRVSSPPTSDAFYTVLVFRLQPHANKHCDLAIFDRSDFPQRLIQAAGPGRPTRTGPCPADADPLCRHPLPRASRISLFFALASTRFHFVKDLRQRHMANSFVLKSLKLEHVGTNEQRICHPFIKIGRHFIPIIKHLSSCHGSEGYSLFLITLHSPIFQNQQYQTPCLCLIVICLLITSPIST